MLRSTAEGEVDALIRFLCCGYFFNPSVTTCHLPYITPQHPAMLRGTAGEEFYVSPIEKTGIPRNAAGHGR